MGTDLLRLLGGGVLLYLGAEWLVRGAAGLARAMGVRPLVIGLTVVAYGTSAPELVVTLLSALEGKSAIALGNVLGSNIANLGLILGIVALLAPPRVDATLIRMEVPVLVASALLVPVMLWNGVVSRREGALLVAGATAFTFLTLRVARASSTQTSELGQEAREEAAQEAGSGSRVTLSALCAVGLAALVVGGKLLVDGASGIALAFGMSERLVGLTIVAVGTSLPELAASVVAALRGHASMAIGNIIGSNIFNVLLILGAASVARPLTGSPGTLALDLGALLAFSVATVLLMWKDRHISRPEGALLLAGYAGFVVAAATQGG